MIDNPYIEVTQEDIDKARHASWPRSTMCPIARAMQRALHQPGIGVGIGGIVFTPNGEYFLPGIAEEFVREFDRRNEVQPFSFVWV